MVSWARSGFTAGAAGRHCTLAARDESAAQRAGANERACTLAHSTLARCCVAPSPTQGATHRPASGDVCRGSTASIRACTLAIDLRPERRRSMPPPFARRVPLHARGSERECSAAGKGERLLLPVRTQHAGAMLCGTLSGGVDQMRVPHIDPLPRPELNRRRAMCAEGQRRRLALARSPSISARSGGDQCHSVAIRLRRRCARLSPSRPSAVPCATPRYPCA